MITGRKNKKKLFRNNWVLFYFKYENNYKYFLNTQSLLYNFYAPYAIKTKKNKGLFLWCKKLSFYEFVKWLLLESFSFENIGEKYFFLRMHKLYT